MATKEIIEYIDDLDPTGKTRADETVPFMYEGVEYEIDLSASNAERLRSALLGYVAAGRRTGGRLKRQRAGAVQRGGGSSAEAPVIREWANTNGYGLTGRGRIPNHVVDAYREAQAAAANAKKKTAKKKRS